MATLYRKGGEAVGYAEVVTEVFPKNGKTFTLEELQGFVEGNGSKTIQYLPLPDGRVMFANDNGRIVGLPQNFAASTFWREQYPIEKYPHNNEGIIVGTVVVCSRKEAGDEDDNGDES